jgi:hypothetical protein
MREFDFTQVRANLFLSIGVPYSHLNETEMDLVLGRIFQALEAGESPSVVIIDVLGRYSMEWLPLAVVNRREYAMTFFSEVTSPPVAIMTFYSGGDLSRTVTKSIPADMRSRLVGYNFWDRSIFAGRHTLTCQYNRQMPPLRSLLNKISSVDRIAGNVVEQLRIPPSAIESRDMKIPEVVTHSLATLSDEWNSAVRDAAEKSEVDSQSLCDSLKSIDQRWSSKGTGIGHSLTAVLRFKGRC